MCLQFSVDNYLLQVQGWALTEYGDSLLSLVNTPSLNNKSVNVHSSVSDIVTKEVSITLHYILFQSQTTMFLCRFLSGRFTNYRTCEFIRFAKRMLIDCYHLYSFLCVCSVGWFHLILISWHHTSLVKMKSLKPFQLPNFPILTNEIGMCGFGKIPFRVQFEFVELEPKTGML